MEWNKLYDYSYMMKNKSSIREKYEKSDKLLPIRIAILAGSTVGALKEFIEIFLYQYDIQAVFWEGNYNRIYEEALFDNDELENFKPDIVYIHMSNMNLLKSIQEDNMIESEYLKLYEVWESLWNKYKCHVIQNNFEYCPYRIIGNASRYVETGLTYRIEQLNQTISEYARKHQWFLVNDLNWISSYVGLEKWYNDRFWALYKYPFDLSVQPRVAANIASIVKAILGKNKKTIITDLDNTLWKGIVGEIGAEHIEMSCETANGEQYQKIQMYLNSLRQCGIILNVCSKNDYEVGLSGLEHCESILKPEDFIVKKINWDEKYQNVKQIMEEINLGFDSAVFMDDNIVECESVQAFLPEVECLQVKSATDFIRQMEENGFFEIVQLNKADQERERYYRQNMKRNENIQKYADYNEYLKTLDMKCIISYINDDNKERIFQLANKTNQFNLTNWRLVQQDIDMLLNDDAYVVLSGKLEDKYGSDGIVSCIVIKQDSRSAEIKLWIMSCRVFKRELEYAMWNELCRECKKRGIDTLIGVYKPSEKNVKTKDFYLQLGFVQMENGVSGETKWIYENIQNAKEIKTEILMERE